MASTKVMLMGLDLPNYFSEFENPPPHYSSHNKVLQIDGPTTLRFTEITSEKNFNGHGWTAMNHFLTLEVWNEHERSQMTIKLGAEALTIVPKLTAPSGLAPLLIQSPTPIHAEYAPGPRYAERRRGRIIILESE